VSFLLSKFLSLFVFFSFAYCVIERRERRETDRETEDGKKKKKKKKKKKRRGEVVHGT